ncbi:MAG: ParB/RepB/Spo0J family partition protein [Candidatus Saelkia tenebricola]|nr:ParB/RepB/Spo0J family partition protein [Candidatus Saelkia tenebricola]
MEKKTGLGKGLSALIPEKTGVDFKKYKEINVSRIALNPFQPRKVFVEQEVINLKASILKDGLLQPILVVVEGDAYKLIAGERRFRAIKMLGWDKVPALVLNAVEEVELLRKSLVENIQRTNLNPIEEAQAYKKLIEEYGYSLENVAVEVGKDFSTISNTLRLLNLPLDVQEDLQQGFISSGHARALLMLQNEAALRKLLKAIKTGNISVREAEKRVRIQKNRDIDPNISSILEELQRKLGTKIEIMPKKKGGKIEISYFSNEDLEKVLNVLLK